MYTIRIRYTEGNDSDIVAYQLLNDEKVILEDVSEHFKELSRGESFLHTVDYLVKRVPNGSILVLETNDNVVIYADSVNPDLNDIKEKIHNTIKINNLEFEQKRLENTDDLKRLLKEFKK
ncbi:hypothetical protein [Vagococcus carniphilus]|uniref:hypothetical protein n=1 Tax=Vagococcus carniphilus TaxID=218144 RepID=UPI002891D5BB|nr:hypothetical protein [Vagococcus carniphilus]MDT2814779.1 hypothetical protein [Vagococcus carniphilus]MDT2864822.1 hypothetical protein [Vagococcus carniphilus]